MNRQKQKAQKTLDNILGAATELFATEEFNNVSVADIVAKANCSIGAFYGHFKSKEELATKVWLTEMLALIRESVEKGSRIKETEPFVDFLIARSNYSANQPLMINLTRFSKLDDEDQALLTFQVSRYLNMIRNMIASNASEASEARLWTYASIIHSLLNSHATRLSTYGAYFQFDDSVLREAILAMMNLACGESNGK